MMKRVKIDYSNLTKKEKVFFWIRQALYILILAVVGFAIICINFVGINNSNSDDDSVAYAESSTVSSLTNIKSTSALLPSGSSSDSVPSSTVYLSVRNDITNFYSVVDKSTFEPYWSRFNLSYAGTSFLTMDGYYYPSVVDTFDNGYYQLGSGHMASSISHTPSFPVLHDIGSSSYDSAQSTYDVGSISCVSYGGYYVYGFISFSLVSLYRMHDYYNLGGSVLDDIFSRFDYMGLSFGSTYDLLFVGGTYSSSSHILLGSASMPDIYSSTTSACYYAYPRSSSYRRFIGFNVTYDSLTSSYGFCSACMNLLLTYYYPGDVTDTVSKYPSTWNFFFMGEYESAIVNGVSGSQWYFNTNNYGESVINYGCTFYNYTVNTSSVSGDLSIRSFVDSVLLNYVTGTVQTSTKYSLSDGSLVYNYFTFDSMPSGLNYNNLLFVVQGFSSTSGLDSLMALNSGFALLDYYSDVDSAILNNAFGYSLGYEDGYNAGSSSGYDSGYTAGYNDGEAFGASSQWSEPVTVLLGAVGTMFDTKLFGYFSLGTLVSVMVYLFIAIIFLRLFAGN